MNLRFSIFFYLSVFLIFDAGMVKSETLKKYQCNYSFVCLDTGECFDRNLRTTITFGENVGFVETPGQVFPVSLVQNAGNGAITVITGPVKGSTAIFTIFANLESRMTFHFHTPTPSSMINVGKCERGS